MGNKLFWMVVLAITSTACRETVNLQAVEPVVRVEPASIDFGRVSVGMTQSQWLSVQNQGRTSVRLQEGFNQTLPGEFSVRFDAGVIKPFSSQEVRVTFFPKEERSYSDLIGVVTDGASSVFTANGQGAPAPILAAPGVLDFETLEVDTERYLPIWFENPTQLPLQLNVTGTDASHFEVLTDIISPDSRQNVTVKFQPTRIGNFDARIEARLCPRCESTEVRLSGTSVATAFVFSPSPLPFPEVPVHEVSKAKTRATNVTWRPLGVTGLLATDSFSVVSGLPGVPIGKNEGFDIDLSYQARVAGTDFGLLTLQYESSRRGNATVELDARGGRAQLAVTPTSLDFGELPVGAKTARRIRLTNAGRRGDLVIRGFRANGALADFSVSNPTRDATEVPFVPGSTWPNLSLPPTALLPGGEDALDVDVFFAPTQAGLFQAELLLMSDDLFNPERVVTLRGVARESGPCAFEVAPSVVNFGNVPPGRGAVLGFQFRNTGTTECAVKDIAIQDSADGVFRMPGGPIVGGAVPEGTAFSSQISFSPNQSGTYEGLLLLTVNDANSSTIQLPLRAMAYDSCLEARPPYLDFGAVRYDCASPVRNTRVVNACPFSIDISDIYIGEGTSQQFSFASSLEAPLVLLPGESLDLSAEYARNVHGQHTSPLFVESPKEPGPFLIPLLAETNHEGLVEDVFVQQDARKLDVLVVVSNTTTMKPYQDRLAVAVPTWFAQAGSEGVDLRVGVTTSGLFPRSAACPGGAEGGEAGRLFPVDSSRARWVGAGDTNGIATLQENLRVGMCHNLAQGLEAMRAALSEPLASNVDDVRSALPNDGNQGFLRAEAQLAVLFLADEDDSSGFSSDSYAEFLRNVKGFGLAQRASAFGVIPTDTQCQTAGATATRLLDVIQKTGGESLSVCRSSYGDVLRRLTRRAALLQDTFPLSATPAAAADVRVSVNGTPLPRARWRYDAAANTVVFTSGNVPAPGQIVRVEYRSICR